MKAPPGTYTVRMSMNGEVGASESFTLLADPRIPEVTDADYAEQFRVATAVRDSITQVTRAIETLMAINAQVESVMDKADVAGQADVLAPLADTLQEKSTEVHEELMQTKNESGQDPIRNPPRLDNQWVELYNAVTGVDGYISGGPEGRPNPGAMERFDDLNADWGEVRVKVQGILQNDLARFNELVERLGLPAVVLPDRPRVIS